MDIQLLNEAWEPVYDQFLLKDKSTLLYASNTYRIFLNGLLNCETNYFLAIENGQIIGALPAILKENPRYGNVLNSLPFFGSNGGVIEHNRNESVRSALLQAFYAFANKKNCVSSTIIFSPFEKDYAFYEKNIPYVFKDYRIGQVTKLPTGGASIVDELLSLFSSIRRRNIQKALEHKVTVRVDNSQENIQFLRETHVANMQDIGATYKSNKFFDLLTECFNFDQDYKIYTAYIDDEPIAALLLFYFNKTVEYFIPATRSEFRPFQPSSLLIFNAMQDAANAGYRQWNWGGTWPSQQNVYDFKKRWGAGDYPYYYFTKTSDEISQIKALTKEKILEEYPNFYVIPFDMLENGT